MRDDIERGQWASCLAEFNARNQTRPTRLEVIGQAGAVASDFWLAEGLPLAGISLDPDGADAPQVAIMLDGQTADAARHLTHTVIDVRQVRREFGADGREAVLEIEDKDGLTTILRFE